ncbi:MAG: restriction endonuclease subunit S [Bacilli bacterium]
MEEKFLRPKIRFKGFTDAWEQYKFDSITFPSGVKNADNLLLESYSITNEAGFIPQNIQFENGGTMRDADKSMYYIVSPRSFAYNPARINVGSIGYYNQSKNVIVSSLYEVFQTTNNIDDRFLWHWFKTDHFQKLIEQYQEGGVRLYFYYDKLCKGQLPAPQLIEQRKIGSLLDNIDNLITLHQRKYDKLVNTKKALLDKMFPKNGELVPKLRFRGFTDAWEQCKLGNLGRTQSGVGFPDVEQGGQEGIPFYKVSDMNTPGNEHEMLNANHYVTNDQIAKRAWNPIDSVPAIMFAKVGAAVMLNRKRLVSRPFLLDNNTMAYSFGAQLDTKFGKTLFDTIYLPSLVQVGALPSYNATDINELEVKVPKLDEQSKIGLVFSNIDNLITLHQRKYEKLKNIKKALLEKIFV